MWHKATRLIACDVEIFSAAVLTLDNNALIAKFAIDAVYTCAKFHDGRKIVTSITNERTNE